MSVALEYPLYHGVWRDRLEDMRMTAEKARTIIGNRVVSLTRYVMGRDGLSQDAAYARLYGTEFFSLLSDPETRLYLEEDDYLQSAYLKEVSEGVDAMYAFIRPEP